MRTPLATWQVAGLQRLSEKYPVQVEAALQALWDLRPDLLEEITLAALDDESMDLAEGAKALGIGESELEGKLGAFRRRALKRRCIVVCDGNEAKVADGELPIWEIVRVHRRLGSLEKLRTAFPGVAPETLEAGLAYAKANPEEIESQIEGYEKIVAERSKKHVLGNL